MSGLYNTDGLYNNLLANALLAVAYAVYKVYDRCLASKCKYTRDGGFAFDLADAPDCPATDMEKIADLLKSRAMAYEKRPTSRTTV